jgi:hypothetical protein
LRAGTCRSVTVCVKWCGALVGFLSKKKIYDLTILKVSLRFGPCTKTQKRTIFLQQKAIRQRWGKIWYFENALLATPHSSLALTFHRSKTISLKTDHTTDITLHIESTH